MKWRVQIALYLLIRLWAEFCQRSRLQWNSWRIPEEFQSQLVYPILKNCWLLGRSSFDSLFIQLPNLATWIQLHRMRGIVPYATLLPSIGKKHRQSLKMLRLIALLTNKSLSHQLQSVKLLKVKNFIDPTMFGL